jgi:hypothetical protein
MHNAYVLSSDSVVCYVDLSSEELVKLMKYEALQPLADAKPERNREVCTNLYYVR